MAAAFEIAGIQLGDRDHTGVGDRRQYGDVQHDPGGAAETARVSRSGLACAGNGGFSRTAESVQLYRKWAPFSSRHSIWRSGAARRQRRSRAYESRLIFCTSWRRLGGWRDSGDGESAVPDERNGLEDFCGSGLRVGDRGAGGELCPRAKGEADRSDGGAASRIVRPDIVISVIRQVADGARSVDSSVNSEGEH